MLEQEELCKNAIKKGRLKVVKRPVLIAIIGYNRYYNGAIL